MWRETDTWVTAVQEWKDYITTVLSEIPLITTQAFAQHLPTHIHTDGWKDRMTDRWMDGRKFELNRYLGRRLLVATMWEHYRSNNMLL